MDLYSLTYILAIAAMIFSVYAQFRVNAVYKKYAAVAGKKGITGAEAAARLLEAAGVHDLPIEAIPGNLTDHYDPRDGVLRLSKEVYGGTSLSAIGVAAHEAGHAVQHSEGYAPLMARQNFVKVANIGSRMSIPIVFLGIVLMNITPGGAFGEFVVTVGLLMFAAVVLMSLITLPVEFNASSRALAMIESHDILDGDEIVYARKVLNAAAWTYIAATLSAVLTLIRLVMMARGGSRRR